MRRSIFLPIYCLFLSASGAGTPHRLQADAIATDLTASTDRLHIGNRWLGHSGLGWYDNTAACTIPC